MVDCGSSEVNKGIELILSNVNTIEDYTEFSLYKITTTDEIKAPIHTGLYYKSKSDQETYVDVIIDWKNLSTQTLLEKDLLTITATNENGVSYNDVLYAVERERGTSIGQYEDIAPLTTSRIHCGISVPKTETNLTITLNIKNELYFIEYSLGNTISDAKELKVNDVIEDQDYASVIFKGIEYTDDLLPTDTSSAYRHYQVDDTNNTYLVVKFEVKSLMNDDQRCDEIFGINAIYMDKYKYDGFMIMADEDGRGFTTYGSIKPLTTREFFYLIEVPKSVIEEKLKLNIYFHNKEYYFKS